MRDQERKLIVEAEQRKKQREIEKIEVRIRS